MLPLVVELPRGHGDPLRRQRALVRGPVHAVGVEPVPVLGRGGPHGVQVGADGGHGFRVRPEPVELRMGGVALRAAEQHGLREECLAPARGESLPVEQGGVQRPEPHPQLSSPRSVQGYH
nr:hypothetical protein GCM10025730_02720 [Promicromonospora thailandica]